MQTSKMSTVQAMSHNLDLLISEWHELADQSPEVIDDRFALDGQSIVDRVLREVMGISPTVEISSSSEFLISNERQPSGSLRFRSPSENPASTVLLEIELDSSPLRPPPVVLWR
jgi:hypothetical protein